MLCLGSCLPSYPLADGRDVHGDEEPLCLGWHVLVVSPLIPALQCKASTKGLSFAEPLED